MFRKLSLAVAISGLLSPVGVHALGLGDIHLGSALNQRLNAEIMVHLARTEELGDMKVELASPEAFARAGIGRPFILSGLRFSPVQNSDGETIIAVTSRDPIREPFLNFLVEVNWPKGRLVREYTVLLDPPTTVRRSAAPIESPVVTSQLRGAEVTPASRQARAGGEREYGPVVTEDTLWNIASRMRADGESVEQVMMALLDNNPSAFIHNNINRLKRGSILRLPASDDVQALDREQARSEFLAQTSQWRDQNSISASSINNVPTKTTTSEGAVAGQYNHLKLASASKKSAETGALEGRSEKSVDISELEQELILVREANEVVRQEGAQLRSRVGELETQLQDIQRLLTLRNDQLAQMQTSQQQDQPVEEVSEEVVDEAPAADTPIVAIPEEVVEEGLEVAPVSQEIQETIEPLAQEEEAEAPPVVAETASQPEVKPAVATPVNQPPAATGLDSILNNPTLLAAAGGVVALLLAAVAFIVRRRKTTEAEFAESILVAPKGAVDEGSSDTDLAPASTDETSLLSDFSPSDIDALQDETGEVDPLSEADVYVAYGRYQQAEELIQQAIERDDGRIELKFKLLEIYYSTQNRGAFIELAQRLANEGAEGKNPQAWAQVVSMGQELDPGEMLFGSGVGQQPSDTGEDVENALDEIEDFDLGDLDAELGLDGDDALLNADVEQSLDDQNEVAELPSQTESEADEIDLLSDPDDGSLELGGLSIADESLDLDDIDLSAELGGEISDLDLDDLSLSLDSELALDESEGKEAAEQLASEEIDLDSLGDDLESLSDELDAGDFEINLDEMSSTLEDEIQVDDTEASESFEGSEAELPDDDEVETKLDLARAYADMGDKEGAENILQEVLSEGTAEQIEEAETLIKSLS